MNPVQYDVMKDFAPISLLSTSPVLFVGRNSLPQGTLRELIDWLRANPGKASLATTGQGGGPHITGGAFQAKKGETPGETVARCYPILIAARRQSYEALAHCILPVAELRAPALDAAAFLAQVKLRLERTK